MINISNLDIVQLNTLLGVVTPIVLQLLLAQHLSANRKRLFAFGFCLVVSLLEFTLSANHSGLTIVTGAVTLFGSSTAMYHAVFEGKLGALAQLDPIGSLLASFQKKDQGA